MSEIEKYFNSCMDYWIGNGDSKGVATIKTIWWDCVEVWNADKSWTEEKVQFIKKWRDYEPYGEVPPSEFVENGNA